MRLWHYKLLKYLPSLQLIAQWRELNSIFKKQDNHILINYIYDYPESDLMSYAELVLSELHKRRIKVNKGKDSNYAKWVDATFPKEETITLTQTPFEYHHNMRYLTQCFYNLQEKYDRYQTGFSQKTYEELKDFYERECNI